MKRCIPTRKFRNSTNFSSWPSFVRTWSFCLWTQKKTTYLWLRRGKRTLAEKKTQSLKCSATKLCALSETEWCDLLPKLTLRNASQIFASESSFATPKVTTHTILTNLYLETTTIRIKTHKSLCPTSRIPNTEYPQWSKSRTSADNSREINCYRRYLMCQPAWMTCIESVVTSSKRVSTWCWLAVQEVQSKNWCS